MKISPLNQVRITANTKITSPQKSISNQAANRQYTSEILPSAYYLPVSFTSKRHYSSCKPELFEKPSDFKVCQHSDVPCPACGSLMMTKEEFAKFCDRIDNAEKDESYLDILADYQKYMRRVEKNAYRDMCILSRQTGETNIKKLVKTLEKQKLPML